MQIYLPIAEVSVNILLLLTMGAAVGFLSGLFGVGGGFLMTPLLIFAGVPPAVVVGTSASQIVASSVSGVLAHWSRGNVDFKMGLVLLVGGFLGSSFGVLLFTVLKQLGQIDLVITLSYVVLLSIIGVLMLVEATRAFLRAPQPDRAAAQAAPAYLGAWPAVQDALPPVAALHQRAIAHGHRLHRRRPGRRSWASAAASSWCRR